MGETEYRACLKIAPHYVAARNNLGLLLMNWKHDGPAAEDAFRQVRCASAREGGRAARPWGLLLRRARESCEESVLPPAGGGGRAKNRPSRDDALAKETRRRSRRRAVAGSVCVVAAR